MKNYYLLVLFLFCPVVNSFGQTQASADTAKTATLKIDTVTVNLDFLFNLTHKQNNPHPDLKFINMAQASYVHNYTDYGLYFRQILDRLASGYLYYNHYLNLSAGIAKYKPLSGKKAMLRFLYPEPVFIYQNNSGRGLHHRIQTGLFFYPVRYYRPKIKLNAGIGCLYDWSSWEVNDMNKINAAKPEVREKILFINSHSKLRDDMYMNNTEFRPTLFVLLGYQITEKLNAGVFFSYQQSVVSPFSEEIKAVYPELKKVYPYTYTQLSLSAKLHKGFSVKSSFLLDYENNNLSIYDSSWEYSLLLGLTWNFKK